MSLSTLNNAHFLCRVFWTFWFPTNIAVFLQLQFWNRRYISILSLKKWEKTWCISMLIFSQTEMYFCPQSAAQSHFAKRMSTSKFFCALSCPKLIASQKWSETQKANHVEKMFQKRAFENSASFQIF